MRNIQFRAKSLLTGEWVYGDYMTRWRGEDQGTEHYIVSHPNGRDSGREVLQAIDQGTLGQYVGVDDREHHPIFEHDRVRVYRTSEGSLTAGEENQIVSTRIIRYGTVSSDLDASGYRVTPGHSYLYLVIGNIHDDAAAEAAL